MTSFDLLEVEEQGRPVRALCDASMHHGKSRGGKNTRKVCKKTLILRNQGEEICGK